MNNELQKLMAAHQELAQERDALFTEGALKDAVIEAAQNIDNLWGREGLSNLPADIALMDALSEALAAVSGTPDA